LLGDDGGLVRREGVLDVIHGLGGAEEDVVFELEPGASVHQLRSEVGGPLRHVHLFDVVFVLVEHLLLGLVHMLDVYVLHRLVRGDDRLPTQLHVHLYVAHGRLLLENLVLLGHVASVELEELDGAGLFGLDLDELGHEVDFLVLASQLQPIALEDGGLLDHFLMQLIEGVFHDLGDFILDVFSVGLDLLDFLLDVLHLVNDGFFLFVEGDVDGFGVVDGLVVGLVDGDDLVLVLPLLVRHLVQHALRTERLLAMIAVVLISSVWVLYAELVVLLLLVDGDPHMLAHDLVQVVLLEALVRNQVALLTEVSLVILTVLDRLVPTRAHIEISDACWEFDSDFALDHVGEEEAFLVEDEVLVLEHVPIAVLFEVDGVVAGGEGDLLVVMAALIVAVGLADGHLVEVEGVEDVLLELLCGLDDGPCFEHLGLVCRNKGSCLIDLVRLAVVVGFDPAFEGGLIPVPLVEAHGARVRLEDLEAVEATVEHPEGQLEGVLDPPEDLRVLGNRHQLLIHLR